MPRARRTRGGKLRGSQLAAIGTTAALAGLAGYVATHPKRNDIAADLLVRAAKSTIPAPRERRGGAATLQDDVRLARAAYGGKPVEGYTIDPELSNDNYTTYRDPQGKATVSYRGTDTKNWRDLGTDALLAFTGVQGAQKLSRFKNAKDVAERAKSKYGAENVSLTGHSLGGSQVLAISNQTGLPGRSFNPYASLGDALWNRRNYEKVENYHHKNDPISFFSRYMKRLKTTVSRKKTKDPHGLGAIGGMVSTRMHTKALQDELREQFKALHDSFLNAKRTQPFLYAAFVRDHEVPRYRGDGSVQGYQNVEKAYTKIRSRLDTLSVEQLENYIGDLEDVMNTMTDILQRDRPGDNTFVAAERADGTEN